MRHKLATIFLAGAMFAGSAAAEVVIRVAPPRPVHRGAIGVAPSRNHVWVNGYHEWSGDRYVWREGSWTARPNPHARWVEARYVRRQGGWVFVPGHWR